MHDLIDPHSRRMIESAPELPTERARTGDPVVTYRGRRLHSHVDPRREARDVLQSHVEEIDAWLRRSDESPHMVLLGPGLGYLIGALDELLRDRGVGTNQVTITCIEMSPSVARKALTERVWGSTAMAIRWVTVGDGDREALPDGEPWVLQGNPGYGMHRAEYDRFLSAMDLSGPAERPMRILVPTPLYGGSHPMALHCADAFRRLGHAVELLDLSDHYPLYSGITRRSRDRRHRKLLQSLLTTYLAETIVARALDWKADLVWAVAQTPMTPAALGELRHERIHSAFWFVEDYRVFDYWRMLCPHFDMVFTIQRGECHEELRRAGVSEPHYLPCAANPAAHFPEKLSDDDRRRFGSSVSFVGAGYGNRQTALGTLGLTDLKIWGNDWPSSCAAHRFVQEDARRITTEETRKIFCGTQVNLNLHSSSSHRGVNPEGDFVNPRTFEIACCGGFQLVDRRSELANLFQENEEIAVFDNVRELPERIQYYLDRPAERAEIARRGRERVLHEHTYEHRMQTALTCLEERFPRLKARKRGPNYISSLIEAAGEDRELVEFLRQFEPDEEADLDSIVQHIQLGRGQLTRAESTFLLMKEFRDWGIEKGVIS